MELKVNKQLEEIIPKLNDEEFDCLKTSISTKGLQKPIDVAYLEDTEFPTLPTIVDGHNRYRALTELGLEPEETDLTILKNIKTIKEALDYSFEVNFARRQLNAFSKAKWAIEVYGIYISHEELADMVHVHEKTIDQVSVILKKAPQNIIDEGVRGERGITDLYKTVKTTEKVMELIDSLNPVIQDAIKKQIEPLYFSKDLDLKEVDAIIRKAEGSPAILKKVEFPFEKFVNEKEANKFFADCGGRYIGIKKVWVGEIDPSKVEE